MLGGDLFEPEGELSDVSDDARPIPSRDRHVGLGHRSGTVQQNHGCVVMGAPEPERFKELKWSDGTRRSDTITAAIGRSEITLKASDVEPAYKVVNPPLRGCESRTFESVEVCPTPRTMGVMVNTFPVPALWRSQTATPASSAGLRET
jgi:hypothetical protein